MRLVAGLVLLLGPAVSGIVSAHHSRAGFADDAVAAVRGVVTSFSWTNPHVYIGVDAADSSGEQWLVETDAIPILIRSGWSARSLQVGDPVLVRVNPGTGDEAHHGLLVSVTKADGSVLLPRAHFERDIAARREEARADNLAGVWELPFGETGDFMRSWGAVALTEKGRAAREAFRPEDRPAGRCIPTPTPMLMGMPYLNEIEIHDDRVLLRSEFFDVERIVYLDGRDHPRDAPRTIQGHSIGSWEGDELVVDTRLMADHPAPIRGPNEGVPSGGQRHVVERYRLSEDGKRITIDVHVEDPEYLAEPFEGTLEWVYVPDFELSSFTCQSQ